ncbi:VOC family protein [Nakamurella leprariae]|uniref:Glyoxalase n=1 Tax=Nakamurella leprariae TaxID=2803911 RepID=A0A939C3H4_9ACTN|nr:VOC family protein [Nakamurella leprariae]MBM9469419.1 glyoxalase [Nakamurella leprariae]
MATSSIYVNLPVAELERSKRFFTGLGYRVEPSMTDTNAACIAISDSIFVMLLVHPFFANFTSKRIADTSATAAAILCLSTDERAEVDELVDRALAGGGSRSADPMDQGWLYCRSFQDPDGHLWEVIWTDPAGPSRC